MPKQGWSAGVVPAYRLHPARSLSCASPAPGPPRTRDRGQLPCCCSGRKEQGEASWEGPESPGHAVLSLGTTYLGKMCTPR